jgi:anionic cell wall polymer biosynthesis LytR-Cps2A-Psr (LCP) family protein
VSDAFDPLYVAGRGRRAEARQRRRQRQRLVVGTAAGVVLLVVVTAVALLFLGDDEQVPADVEEQGRTQRTLLMQVQGADRSAVASALLAYDESSESGSVVLVPSQVIVDVPGAGSEPFGQAIATGPPNASSAALADLLGVTIDATWVIDAGAFGALVDRLGGIPAAVEVPVIRDGQVVVPQGQQLLDGARALALLGYLAPGEPEQARLARQQEVLDGLLATLPEAPALTEALTALGPASMVSIPVTGLTDLLFGLAAAAEKQQLTYDSLPVIPIDPGGGVMAFRLDEEAAAALVDRVLAQSVPAGERQTGNRVLVLNGVGTPGLGEAVRAKLVAADFVFVASRNAERFGFPTTQILVPEATPEAQRLGERVAEALGVAPDVRQADLGSIADVVVIVGADFQP